MPSAGVATELEKDASKPGGVNYCVRDFDRSDFDQDYDLHHSVIVPAVTAGPHTLQKEPSFQDGHGPRNAGRWQLAASTPGCDDGITLPNFSDGAIGQGPDHGAHENSAPDLRFDPELWEESVR